MKIVHGCASHALHDPTHPAHTRINVSLKILFSIYAARTLMDVLDMQFGCWYATRWIERHRTSAQNICECIVLYTYICGFLLYVVFYGLTHTGAHAPMSFTYVSSKQFGIYMTRISCTASKYIYKLRLVWLDIYV